MTAKEKIEECQNDINATIIQMSQRGCPHNNSGECPDSCKYSIRTNKGLKVCLLFLCTKFVVTRQHEALTAAANEGILSEEQLRSVKNFKL